jgi:hypothetical protein
MNVSHRPSPVSFVRRRVRGRARAGVVVVASFAIVATLLGDGAAPARAVSQPPPREPSSVGRAASQIEVSSSRVAPGAGLRISGRVPASTSRPVQLQARTGQAWKKVGTSRTRRSGAFAFRTEAPARPGTVRYRVVAPKARTSPATTTRAVVVTVFDPPGSRTNPYRLGQTFRVGDWHVRVQSTDYDSYPESDHDIVDPPEPGWTFVSHLTTYTYRGEGGSTPDMDLSIDFLAADNRVYDAYSGGNVCGNAEPDADDLNDLYAGATATAHDCVSVPTALARGGLWRFENYLGDRQFFVRAG